MNGFTPLFPSRDRHRQLLAFAVAGWLGLASSTGLNAQESEAPAAPPAILSEDLPAVKPAKPAASRPVRPYTRTPKARSVVPNIKQRSVTKLIPTGPEDQDGAAPVNPNTTFGHTTQLIPTDVEMNTAVVKKSPAPAPTIQQVQAETIESAPLVPGDGLDTPALEFPQEDTQLTVPEVQSDEPHVPTVPNEDASPVTIENDPAQTAAESEPPVESENAAPARNMPAVPFEPAAPPEEVESEPAHLEDRAANSQPVPTDFNISRTAAADNQPYNDPGVTGFSPKDTVHTVGSGESFWTIAKKHYRMGRYSAALAEYNKSRIPKPDRIQPGMKVIVPPVETLEQRFGHMISGYITPASVAAAAAAKPGFFVDADAQPFYRVGEGDTLSDIAHNHLGRSSRWVQIVSLNKERLPNPDAMKPGMVLRLPQDASEMVRAE